MTRMEALRGSFEQPNGIPAGEMRKTIDAYENRFEQTPLTPDICTQAASSFGDFKRAPITDCVRQV